MFLLIGLIVPALLFAQSSPPPVQPYDLPTSSIIQGSSHGGTLSKGAGAGPALILAGAADASAWLRSEQLASGGFDWTPGGTSATPNTQGTTAQGLLSAYQHNGLAVDLTAAIATGDYLVPTYPRTFTDSDPKIVTHDTYYLELLSQVTGTSTYADFLQTYFWDKLTAGTYGESNDQDAADYGAAVIAGRASIIELSPWDLAGPAIGAHYAGETAIRNTLMAAVLSGLNQTTSTDNDFEVIGLAGAIWASAVTGIDLDPTAGRYSAASSTADLITTLLTYQTSDGGFPEGTGTSSWPKNVQTTAFAALALFEYDATTYAAEIGKAIAFIRSLQQTNGQILVYPSASTTESGGIECHAEALRALAITAPDVVYVDATWSSTTYGADPDAAGPAIAYKYDAFSSVAEAVDAVAHGGTVHVAAGSYTEQIVVTKDVSILGAGSATTSVVAPASIVSPYSTSYDHYPVIAAINSSTLVLKDVTVDGDGNGNANYKFHGVAFYNAGGSVIDCGIIDIRDTPFSGNQHGVGIYAYVDDSNLRTLTISGTTITGFQKNAMALSGDYTVTVLNNVIVGAGGTSVTAQNGIQVGYGASGTVRGNTVSGIAYTGSGWTASAMLMYDAGSMTIDQNTLTDCQTNIYGLMQNGEITNNTITTDATTIGTTSYLYGIGCWPDGTGSSTFNVARNTVISDGTNGLGIDLWPAGSISATMIAENNIVADWDEGISVGVSGTATLSTAVNGNSITGCATYGLNNYLGSVINAENNWWGSNDGPQDVLPASGGTELPSWPEPTVANMLNIVGTLGNDVSEDVDYYPWSTQNNITQTSYDYQFDGSGDGTDDVTMNFSTLPAGGGNVTVNWYGYVPSHAAALPQGGLNNIFLEITSDLPNYQFEVTITLSALPSGFGSNTKVHFYNTSSHKWQLIGGTYDDNGTPAVTTDDTFTFTVNHFTQFSFVNTPSTPLVLKIDDGIVNDSFDESTISPAATWQGWMGTGDLTDDWSWEHQVFGIAVRPEYSGTGTADIFASSITLQYDPADWSLNTGVGTVGTGVGSIFGTYSLQHLAQEGTAGTDNTITADISITDIGNPQGTVDNVKTLTTFAFTALGGFPSPIVFNDAHVRTNLNEAYILDLNDDGRSRIYLGDVVDTTGSWQTLPTVSIDHSSGDGSVDVYDLNAWSISYFSDVAPSGPLGSYKLKYDLGPTTTNYIDGLPQPDALINFEDLVIFAISYGLSANNSYPKLPVQEHAVAIDLGTPVASGKQMLVPVMLRGPVANVRALSLQFELPDGVTLAGVSKGSLLDENGFLAHKTDDNVVTVDMARMGASLHSEGVLCMLTLDNGSDANLVRALARDGYNRPVEVNGATPSMPLSVTLSQNYPNPFNPNTMIRFTLGESTPVRLEVYTTLGEHVATLLDANRDAGTHAVQWNGRSDDGREVASGMYIYRLTAGATVLQKTMVLNK